MDIQIYETQSQKKTKNVYTDTVQSHCPKSMKNREFEISKRNITHNEQGLLHKTISRFISRKLAGWKGEIIF